MYFLQRVLTRKFGASMEKNFHPLIRAALLHVVKMRDNSIVDLQICAIMLSWNYRLYFLDEGEDKENLVTQKL